MARRDTLPRLHIGQALRGLRWLVNAVALAIAAPVFVLPLVLARY